MSEYQYYEFAAIDQPLTPAQVAEQKARRGEFIPWAYTCYGYRYLPKQPGHAPRAVIDPGEAEVVRQIYRYLIEDQLSCRQITKRLNEAGIATPSGRHPVWYPGTVRQILANPVYGADRLPGRRR